jgi:hypothetical protein
MSTARPSPGRERVSWRGRVRSSDLRLTKAVTRRIESKWSGGSRDPRDADPQRFEGRRSAEDAGGVHRPGVEERGVVGEIAGRRVEISTTGKDRTPSSRMVCLMDLDGCLCLLRYLGILPVSVFGSASQ